MYSLGLVYYYIKGVDMFNSRYLTIKIPDKYYPINTIVPSKELKTLKTFTDKFGHKYELRGKEQFLSKDYKRGHSGIHNVYELYRNKQTDGKDVWQRVAAKDEMYNSDNKKRIMINREKFSLKTGKLTERSTVTDNSLFVHGDVLKMDESICDYPYSPTMPSKIEINLKGKDLTPMSKRILNIIQKFR